LNITKHKTRGFFLGINNYILILFLSSRKKNLLSVAKRKKEAG
jgi:hypothetical protein